VLWTITQAWGTRIMSIAVFVVLGRQLSPSAFGVMALGVAVVEFGRLLVDQGFSRNIVQRMDLDDEHLDTAFWTALTSGGVLTVVGVALAPLVAGAFDEPQLTSVLRWLSVNFLLAAFTTTQMAILQRALRFRSIAIRRLISVAAGGAVGVGVALAGGGVWALVAQNLTQSLVAVVVLWTVSSWRPGRRFSRSRFREMASFATTTLSIEIVGYFARRGDDLLIGAFLGSVALGFFNVAYRILTIVTEVFTSTINAVAFPVFSRLQGDPTRIRSALHMATRMSSAVAFPAFLGLSVLAPEFVRVLFGDRWDTSVDVLQIIAIVGLLRSVTYFNRSLLIALGKPAWELAWVTLSVSTKVAAFAIGYRFGLTGVAWAVVIHGYALAPVGVWLINRASPIDPRRYLGQFLAPLAASLIMVAVVYPVRAFLEGEVPEVTVLGAGAAAGVAVYALALAVISPALTRELLRQARDVAPGRHRKKDTP
jgi:O-antigen/teichoic acid export membrane protein